MQSSLAEAITGPQVSQKAFNTSQWYKVNVPTTIIAGLLANNKYAFDPFYGNNLDKIAGSEFDTSWWFRKTFMLPAGEKGRNIILKLHGVNYKANIWLNGKMIADTNEIKGPFRFFEKEITALIKYNDSNVLALEIIRPFNPQKRGGDLAIDYADWIHYPADYNGGIVNNVWIGICDKIAVRYPFVETKFDLPNLHNAHLTVYADVVNYSDKPAEATIKGRINTNVVFEQKVQLAPKERREISFTPDAYPQLNIQHPQIWWPWQFGKAALNRIELTVVRNQKAGSRVAENFGIREITSAFITDNAREFIVNGKPILLRGAAWSPDIFQRKSAKRQEQEIKLVKDMNMNIVRSEGKFEDDNFYDLCDKNGLLVMTGWMCCGAWQFPQRWDSVKRNVAMASDSTMMYWLRNKACILTWLNGSDIPPRDTTVERSWLNIEGNLHFPNPILATANESESKVSGKSGVKMDGPYEWVPPSYWEADTAKHGGAYSFATEISPGPSIPPYESLVKFIPADSLTRDDSIWKYHAGTGQFGTTNVFDTALDERYGRSANMREYVNKAQAQNYEGHRAMMEAYGVNKHRTATGVVQWMLSNPWPGIIWHTYDYYMYPAGTYFGVKKGLEPLHVQYSYYSKEVIINNSFLVPFKGLKVKANVYNIDGAVKFSKSLTTDIGPDTVNRCFALPAIGGLTGTYFLRLQLSNQSGKTESINWYWLSAKDDSLAWDKSTWFYTPQSAYTDYSALKELPKTTLAVSHTTTKNEDSTAMVVNIKNTGKSVAFFVHIRALKSKNGDDVLPVIFDDNYLLLAPGESRKVRCIYRNADAGTAVPYLTTTAWNVEEHK
jgi:exo-1,4-beta-D-glucosaminidase